MKIAHLLWSMGTGGTENMVVDIASVQAENNDVCIFVINDWVEEYMFRLVVDKKYASEQLLKEFDQKPTMLTPDDPLFQLED